MDIPVNAAFVSFVALAWVVVIATRAGAQVTMTQDASDIAGDFKHPGESARLDVEDAASPLYVTSPVQTIFAIRAREAVVNCRTGAILDNNGQSGHGVSRACLNHSAAGGWERKGAAGNRCTTAG